MSKERHSRWKDTDFQGWLPSLHSHQAAENCGSCSGMSCFFLLFLAFSCFSHLAQTRTRAFLLLFVITVSPRKRKRKKKEKKTERKAPVRSQEDRATAGDVTAPYSVDPCFRYGSGLGKGRLCASLCPFICSHPTGQDMDSVLAQRLSDGFGPSFVNYCSRRCRSWVRNREQTLTTASSERLEPTEICAV